MPIIVTGERRKDRLTAEVSVPGAPLTITVSVSGTSATVAWSAPANDGGSPVTAWRVARDGLDANGAGPWSTTVSAATSSFTFTNLEPGNTYTLTVAAINAVGDGTPNASPATIPAANTQVGAMALGTAVYAIPSPVPANYRFVDQANGSDSNDGTQGAPVATIGKGCSLCPAGGVVVVEDGVYTEEVSVFKTLTVQNAPGAVVWLDGSVVLTNWAQSGATWVSSGWSTAFTVTPSRYLVSAGDVQQHLDMVFFDGTLMTQVAAGSTPAAGQFAVDYSADTITIGSNPSGHELRATNKRTAYLVGTGAGTGALRGIGFRRYSQDSYDGRNGAGVYVGGGTVNYTVENCVFDQMGFGALEMYKTADGLVRWCDFRRSGYGAVGATQCDGIAVRANYFTQGNYRRFKVANDNGSVKITRADGVDLRGNTVYHNNGQTMLWVDVNVTNFVIVYNVLDGTDLAAHSAIQVEESDGGNIGGTQHRGIIASNVISGAQYGVPIWASGHIAVYNNDLSQCTTYDVGLVQDRMWNGTDTYRSQAESGWLTTGVEVTNNVFRSSSALWELYVQDLGPLMPSQTWFPAGQQPTGRPASQLIDGGIKTNLFIGTAGTTKMVGLVLTTSGTPVTTYKDVTSLQQANTLAAGNLSASTLPATLPHSSATPLPQDVADALGVPVGTQHMGPF